MNIQVFGDTFDLFRVFVYEKDVLVLFGELLRNMIAYLARSDDDDFQIKIPLERVLSGFSPRLLLEQEKKSQSMGPSILKGSC